MSAFISLWYLLGQVVKNLFTSPLFLIIYILLLILIIWQYFRLTSEKTDESGFSSRLIFLIREPSPILKGIMSAFCGFLGGIAGSFLLIIIGIDLASIGIVQLWIAAVILMLINPRYLCFAYAGGAVALISLITGYPDINIPHLMALVAVLHLVESMLIYFNGAFGPVSVKVNKEGILREGFNLQKFWPLPLMVLMSTGYNQFSWVSLMPDWWPLLPGYAGDFARSLDYQILPVLAVLGYGEITTVDSPQERCKKSSKRLLVFSLLLLSFSFLAAKWQFFMPVLVFFSPLGHEFIIWLGMKEEGDKVNFLDYRECSLFVNLMNRLKAKKF
ncbi:hypothetical protein [Thermosyntropha sp.]|uniref:hypothetical protein n=1 Tax=Thermosyntropha sp. TaxID=2740820 RepID=UPI0025F438D8|nr:hypothetical protein [Thermosyntropha sp.]MBO8159016.1 hypothetical protein [Thermosyntropha sp.]